MKDAGNVFWFQKSFGEALTCKQLSKFIKIKSKNCLYIFIFWQMISTWFFQYEIFFMHLEQAVALTIWFKRTYLSEKSQSFRVSVFYRKIGDKNFRFARKGEELCLRFFETVNKSNIVLPHGNKGQIRNRCPHFWKETFCAFDYLKWWANLSSYSCFEFLCLLENAARFFWKKAFVAITSVSLKIKLESRKWQLLPASGAPGVAKSWRPRVNKNKK